MKKRTKILIGILTVCVIALIILDLRSTLGWDQRQALKAPTFKIGEYTLVEGRTKYLESAKTTLAEALKNDDEQAKVKELASYFVADYFTLKNKSTFNDVGGLGLVLPAVRSQFKTNAIDSYYVDLSSFIKAYKAQNLPEVTGVKVEQVQQLDKNPDLSKYKDAQGKAVVVEKAYDVSTSFNYKDNNVLDISNLVNKAVVRLVQVNNIWYVLELMQ